MSFGGVAVTIRRRAIGGVDLRCKPAANCEKAAPTNSSMTTLRLMLTSDFLDTEAILRVPIAKRRYRRLAEPLGQNLAISADDRREEGSGAYSKSDRGSPDCRIMLDRVPALTEL